VIFVRKTGIRGYVEQYFISLKPKIFDGAANPCFDIFDFASVSNKHLEAHSIATETRAHRNKPHGMVLIDQVFFKALLLL